MLFVTWYIFITWPGIYPTKKPNQLLNSILQLKSCSSTIAPWRYLYLPMRITWWIKNRSSFFKCWPFLVMFLSLSFDSGKESDSTILRYSLLLTIRDKLFVSCTVSFSCIDHHAARKQQKLCGIFAFVSSVVSQWTCSCGDGLKNIKWSHCDFLCQRL